MTIAEAILLLDQHFEEIHKVWESLPDGATLLEAAMLWKSRQENVVASASSGPELNATDILFEVARKGKHPICHRLVQLLRRMPRPVRILAGRSLLKSYCDDSGDEEDAEGFWERFRQWLEDHMVEIGFARLLVSLLLLLLML